MKLAQYFQSGSFAVFNKAVVTLCSLAIVWLATDYLGKEAFGHFIYAYSLISILAAIVSAPATSILLYRVSRLKPAEKKSQTYAAYMLATTMVLSLIFTAALALPAGFWANLIDKPAQEFWFVWLALLLPLDALRVTLASWKQAQQKPITMMLYNEFLPFVLRCAFLFAVWLLSDGDFMAMIAALLAAVIIPLVLCYRHDPVSPLRLGDKNPIEKWDIMYALKSLAIQVIHRPSQNIDILLIGALAPAEVVAEYALASRLAGLLMTGKDALMPLLGARMGELMAAGNTTELMREYRQSRNISLALALLGCMFYILFGDYILMLFDGYQSSYPLLIALCSVMLVRIGTGANGEYVIMRGDAGWSLAATIPSVLIGLLTGLALIPAMGGLGAALALFAMVASVNIMLSFYILIRDKIVVCDLALTILLIISCAALFAAPAGLISYPLLLGVMALITVLFSIITRHDWGLLITFVKGTLKP